MHSCTWLLIFTFFDLLTFVFIVVSDKPFPRVFADAFVSILQPAPVFLVNLILELDLYDDFCCICSASLILSLWLVPIVTPDLSTLACQVLWLWFFWVFFSLCLLNFVMANCKFMLFSLSLLLLISPLGSSSLNNSFFCNGGWKKSGDVNKRVVWWSKDPLHFSVNFCKDTGGVESNFMCILNILNYWTYSGIYLNLLCLNYTMLLVTATYFDLFSSIYVSFVHSLWNFPSWSDTVLFRTLLNRYYSFLM